MNLKKIISKDYWRNNEQAFLDNKNTSLEGLSHIIQLYGYPKIDKQQSFANIAGLWKLDHQYYYDVKCWFQDRMGSEAFLVPEQDGLLFILYDSEHNRNTNYTVFDGQNIFISKDSIKDISVQRTPFGNHHLFIEYVYKQEHKTVELKFSMMFVGNWPVQSLQQNYLGAYADNQPMYQHRMQMENQIEGKYVKQKTFQDCTQVPPTFIGKLKKTFQTNTDTFETPKEFTQSLGIIVMVFLLCLAVEVIFAYAESLGTAIFSLILITYGICMYFAVLNIIKYVHGNHLNNQLPNGSKQDKLLYLKHIINNVDKD